MKNKTKQIVVNVSDEAKAKVNELKETLKVTDKEFIDAVLVILKGTSDEVIKAAVDTVTIEKQKAKIAAKIAKIEAQLAEAKAEVLQETTEEVVYSEEDEAETAE
jgi:hypothetical protein